MTSFQEFESWEVDDELWSRDPHTGAFHLTDYKGLGAPPPAHNPLDLAELVGARISTDSIDRGQQPAALYPRAFRFSPLTGKALSEPSSAKRDNWLPPFGEATPPPDGPRGLRTTPMRLKLPATLHAESLPDIEMAMPPAGHYQFLVGAFKTCQPRLVALEFARGLIYHWLPHSECWLEIYPRGGEVLGESSLGEDDWGVTTQDLEAETQIFMPTDDGLAIVSINLIARTYEVRTVGKRCVGAPVMWQGKVYVPMLEDDRRPAIYCLEPPGGAIERLQGTPIDVGSARWMRPLCDRRQIVWTTSKGQVIVHRADGSARPEVSLHPWPSNIRPCFELGRPALEEGAFWQPCVRGDANGRQPVLVRLGREQAEPRPVETSTLGIGPVRQHLADLAPAAPWVESEDEIDPTSAELIFPLLESSTSATLLCARVPRTRSVDEMLASNETFTTTFELLGEQHVRFWTARMPRPWATRAFVYSGRLFLYHPDKRRLPGWRLQA